MVAALVLDMESVSGEIRRNTSGENWLTLSGTAAGLTSRGSGLPATGTPGGAAQGHFRQLAGRGGACCGYRCFSAAQPS